MMKPISLWDASHKSWPPNVSSRPGDLGYFSAKLTRARFFQHPHTHREAKSQFKLQNVSGWAADSG